MLSPSPSPRRPRSSHPTRDPGPEATIDGAAAGPGVWRGERPRASRVQLDELAELDTPTRARRVKAGREPAGAVGVADLNRARDFYGGVLGLPVADESPFAMVVDSNGTMLRLTGDV